MTSEAERITAEYARRVREIPGELYEPTNRAQFFIRQTVERALVEALARSKALPLADKRILDVGCGEGQSLVDLETYGAMQENLAGIDLLEDRAGRGRVRLPAADIRQGDAESLPWDDGSFDIVLQSMMFSSILDPAVCERAAGEITRVLAPAGVVLWYDFFVSTPRNPSVRGVGKGEVRSLFPGFRVDWRRVTLAPPLVRLLAPRARPLASLLQGLRVFDTHAMATLTRSG
jgi:ubiquinone/menaquinone biosynthesis C-methylase UbiE